MGDWKITRRRGQCTACEREFEDGERLVSTLRLGPDGLERGEFCRAWWLSRPEDARGEGCATACRVHAEGAAPEEGVEDVVWWSTRHSVEPKKTVALDLESLERLFLELEDRDEERLRELRYLLCLLLMRKRRLKVEKIERGAEGESFVVRRPRREERHRVFVFDFQPERMEELRAQLQAIFDGAEELDDLGDGEGEPVVEGPEDGFDAEDAEGADAAEGTALAVEDDAR